MIKKSLAITFAFMFLLQGCGSSSTPIIDTNYQDNLLKAVDMSKYQGIIEKTSQELDNSARQVSASLAKLAQIENAVHPGLKMPSEPDAKLRGLGQKIRLDWVGPVAPVLDKVAKTSGYKVRTLGQEPAIPVMVNLQVENVTLADLLRNIKYQILHHAQIEVYAKEKTIELRYNHN